MSAARDELFAHCQKLAAARSAVPPAAAEIDDDRAAGNDSAFLPSEPPAAPQRKAALPARPRKSILLPEIVQLALEGHSNQTIGRKLGVSRQTVGRWLIEQRQKWAETATEKTTELYEVAVARIESVYREAMSAWRRSLTDKQTIIEKAGDDFRDAASLLRKESQSGQAALLGKAIQAAKEICAFKLKHLDAAQQAEEAARQAEKTARQAEKAAQAAQQKAEEERRFLPFRELAEELASLKKPVFYGIVRETTAGLVDSGEFQLVGSDPDVSSQTLLDLPLDDYLTLRELLLNEHNRTIPGRQAIEQNEQNEQTP